MLVNILLLPNIEVLDIVMFILIQFVLLQKSKYNKMRMQKNTLCENYNPIIGIHWYRNPSVYYFLRFFFPF